MTTRAVDGDVVRIIADADGPVRNAIREYGDDCTLASASSFSGYYAYRAYDSEAKGTISSYGGGAIGGRIGERPSTAINFQDSVPHSFLAIEQGLVHWHARLDLHSWSDGKFFSSVPFAQEDAGLSYGQFAAAGGALFWTMSSLAVHRIKLWTPSGGTRDLLTAGNDATRGYADLGTDGEVMVWSEGTRTDTSKPFPRLSVMTSPFGTTTASLKPRFLRNDITGYGFGVTPFVVGCGFAARATFFEPSPGVFTAGIFIVRLSDGLAWRLPDNTGSFQWRTPLAITCNEIFALVHQGPEPPRVFNIARLRLDALGPGMPP